MQRQRVIDQFNVKAIWVVGFLLCYAFFVGSTLYPAPRLGEKVQMVEALVFPNGQTVQQAQASGQIQTVSLPLNEVYRHSELEALKSAWKFLFTCVWLCRYVYLMLAKTGTFEKYIPVVLGALGSIWMYFF